MATCFTTSGVLLAAFLLPAAASAMAATEHSHSDAQPTAVQAVDDTGLPLATPSPAEHMLISNQNMLSEASTQQHGTFRGDGPLPAGSTLYIELGPDPSAAALGLAAQAENAWARGDAATAQRLITQLRGTGELVGDTYAFNEPIVSTARQFADTRIKQVNAQDATLDIDVNTGNLIAVIDEGDDWSVHISTDDGRTWAQTFQFGGDPAHIDMAIVNGFAYVGYAQASAQSQARLRRFSTATGAVDAGFGFEVVFTAPSLGSVLDVAIESNEDLVGNRIYYAIIQSDNRIRYAFDEANDGTTFQEITVNGIVDALDNLDMHWDELGVSPRLHFCYTTTTNQIRHTASGIGGFTAPVFIDSYAGGTVGISAYDDTVMIAYTDSSNPANAKYGVSYNDGVNWSPGVLSGATSTSVFNADVSLRFGYGSAIVVNTEAGAFDPVNLQTRAGYAPGPWTSEQTINAVDALSGGINRIQALPPISSGATYSYGVLYEGTNPLFQPGLYFTRTEDCAWLGDVDGDGDVQLDDLLTVLANFGSVTPVGDANGSGFVDLTDLLIVLAEFGQDCAEI